MSLNLNCFKRTESLTQSFRIYKMKILITIITLLSFNHLFSQKKLKWEQLEVKRGAHVKLISGETFRVKLYTRKQKRLNGKKIELKGFLIFVLDSADNEQLYLSEDSLYFEPCCFGSAIKKQDHFINIEIQDTSLIIIENKLYTILGTLIITNEPFEDPFLLENITIIK